MKQTKIPSLVLAAVLQVMPVCRIATVNPAIASTSYAIVARCAIAIAALLGSVDAVSGASTAVYVAGVQSMLPFVAGVTTNITRPVGSPMVLRIILGGSVGQQPQLDYYNAVPLPPGLIINTNVNTNSSGLESTNYYIYGTPTTPGVYFPVTVSAGNLLYPNGPVYTNIKITITNTAGTSPPSFTTQPQSRTTTNGSNVSFTVAAAGSPVPTLQWRKNGTNLAGATSATYTLSPATTNSAGSYTCLASNNSGSVTSLFAVLTVLDPPSIATQPQSLTVSNGTMASFQVVGFGIPPPTYQWRFNGTNIAGANAATFVINSAQATNEGDYTVVLSNSVNSLVSAPAHLTVQAELSPPRLGMLQLEGGRAAFDVTGPANVKVVILSTSDLRSLTNLASWTPVRTNVAANGTWHFQDTSAIPDGARFYRAVLQP
jgi:hypothetical protein